MAIRKSYGIETEYGILVRGIDTNPISASSLLVNSYASAGKIAWDFLAETPASDARDEWVDSGLHPEVETHLVNTVLTNGARFYVDHAHPEMSTPECSDPLELVRYDSASDEIVRRAMALALEVLPAGCEIVVHKNNSDGKGNSYGCHENYLVDRSVPFAVLAERLMCHFVTRQVFTGSGKVGREWPGRGEPGGFQLSQRADFFEEEVGLETTLKRPIVNSRDEPHCDATKYRRLHVIVGDANMSEWATYMKVGTTALVLAMIEDDRYPRELLLESPVRDIRRISRDPSLRATVEMRDGRTLTAIDAQWHLLEAAEKWSAEFDACSIVGESAPSVLEEWRTTLEALGEDPLVLHDRIDWVAKRRLVEGYRERHGLADTDPRLKAIDLQYHDLRPGRCLAERAGLRRLTAADDVSSAIGEPPETTRAWFRGRVLARFPADVVAANWDSLVVDTGRGALVRIPMMEPFRGTRALVESAIESSNTIGELLARLRSVEPSSDQRD